jgi:abortive infection bacteriophage resistance protein
MKFTKPAKGLPEQLRCMFDRGLSVPDPAYALHYLAHIGYYRLSAYALPFQDKSQPGKPFKPGIVFQQILDLYRFDRELRLLVIDAIERVEISVRAQIVNTMCLAHGTHWFNDPANFQATFNHGRFIAKIEDEFGIKTDASGEKILPTRPQSEVFITHYYKQYGDPYLPPFWMVAETLTLGSLSKLYQGIRDNALRNQISGTYSLNETVLVSWLRSLTYLRNLCAHHSRVWNRDFAIKPLVAKKLGTLLAPFAVKHESGATTDVHPSSRFYSLAVVLFDFLKLVAPGTSWNQRLAALLDGHSFVDPAAMGFPSAWKVEAFWQLPAPPPPAGP